MRLRFLTTALASLAFAATSAHAALVQTKVSSATEVAYSADVSSSDLLAGKTATTTGWNLGNGSTTAELNDGIHGRSFVAAGNSVEGTWTTVGATAIYNLGLGTNNQGYDITLIQTIAAWSGAAFGNQGYTVAVKLKGAGSYTSLATVDYQPLAAGAIGATKVTLTDNSGVLASGVEFIRFTANSVNGGTNAGAFVFREIDVFGTPTADTTPPTISTLNPANGASGVLVSTNLMATFNESIAPGSGSITIKNLSDSTQTVIPVGDPQVSLSGAVLTINPTGNLTALKNYAIWIGPGAITDTAGNPFPGIAIDATWNFTTGAPDLTAPAIVIRNPVDNATNVPTATNLVLTFNESIAPGSGNITIKNLSDSTQTVIPVGNAQVSVSGAVLTINLTGDLAALKNYAIQIDPGAIKDLSANPFPGIDDDSTWSFTTASTPLRIMCLGDSITAGYTDNPSWANHPFKFGYRSGLYTRLTNAGYSFKFVGGSTEPWTGISGDPTLGGTYTPALDLRDFVQDGHRGYGGKTISYINSNVASYIAADTPDVILLLIGINGIGSGSPAALNTLVNTIVTTAPNARLIVAQITPLASFNQDLYNYNIYIRDTLVPSYVAAGKRVSTVNLYSLFLTNPNDYSSAIAPNVLSNGINHPDNPHYDLMAQEWFNGIGALGLGPVNHFAISAIASLQTVGSPIGGITITAQDAANNTATSFTGAVSFGGSAGCTGSSANFVAGVLSGVSVTPTAAGSNLTLTVNDGGNHSGSTIIPTVQTQYVAWSGAAGFDADANGDGVRNGLAWLLGAAIPSANARGLLPVATSEAGNLVLTFRCLKTANRGTAVLKVRYSNDLGQADPWTSHEAVVPDADGTVGGVFFDTTPDDDPAFLNVRAEIPASAASASGRLFDQLHSTGN